MEWGLNSPNVAVPISYIFAFILGGFTLPLIAALAAFLKKNKGKLLSRATIALSAIMVVMCGYSALPDYGYYYQVIIASPDNLEGLEIYIPMAAITEEPYVQLLDYQHSDMLTDAITEGYTAEMVETQHGMMLKITIPELTWRRHPELEYYANIILWQKNAPHKTIHFLPRYNITALNSITGEHYFGPVKTSENKTIEQFEAPLKIYANTTAQVNVTVWNRTDRYSFINFAYTKNTSYTEKIIFEGSTNGDWLTASGEATQLLRIRGFGD